MNARAILIAVALSVHVAAAAPSASAQECSDTPTWCQTPVCSATPYRLGCLLPGSWLFWWLVLGAKSFLDCGWLSC